jgi:hypothetical protein
VLLARAFGAKHREEVDANGELVALGTTSYRNDEAVGIVTEMSSSLDTMREGMDEARRVLRDM